MSFAYSYGYSIEITVAFTFEVQVSPDDESYLLVKHLNSNAKNKNTWYQSKLVKKVQMVVVLWQIIYVPCKHFSIILLRKTFLVKKQRNQLCPKLNHLELDHYHGIPKSREVDWSFQRLYSHVSILLVFSIVWNTIAIYFGIDTRTNNLGLEIFGWSSSTDIS